MTDTIYYDMPPELSEERFYACAVKDCHNFVFDDDDEAKFWDCAKHGMTMTRLVRQFENGRLVSEFHEPLPDKDQGGRHV